MLGWQKIREHVAEGPLHMAAVLGGEEGRLRPPEAATFEPQLLLALLNPALDRESNRRSFGVAAECQGAEAVEVLGFIDFENARPTIDSENRIDLAPFPRRHHLRQHEAG